MDRYIHGGYALFNLLILKWNIKLWKFTSRLACRSLCYKYTLKCWANMDRNIRNGFLPNRNLLFYSSKSIHIVLLMANILFNVDIGLAAGQCPNACSCFALREVDCTRAELTALPPDLPSDTVKLFMGENSLFGPGSLNGLDPLKSLEVISCCCYSFSIINLKEVWV